MKPRAYHAYMARLQEIRRIIEEGPLGDLGMNTALGQDVDRILALTRRAKHRGRPPHRIKVDIWSNTHREVDDD